MWKIGDILIPGRTMLGPMSGYSSVSYRGFMRGFGATVAVTEMISARGLLDDPEGCLPYLRTAEGQITGVQVFGSVPEVVAEGAALALRLNPDIRFVDVNMGCSVPKITARGAGSALMSDPGRCGEMIREVCRAVDVPVTCKMRLGRTRDSMNFQEVAEEVISAGADAITIHSRTADRRYSGPVAHEMVRDLGSNLSVPIVISGNIFTPEDATNAISASNADAVMVARGGVGNPFLVTQIEALLSEGFVPGSPTVSEQIDWCMDLIDSTVEEYGEERASRKLRSIVPEFLLVCDREDCLKEATGHGVGIDDMRHLLERVRTESGDSVITGRNSFSRESA